MEIPYEKPVHIKKITQEEPRVTKTEPRVTKTSPCIEGGSKKKMSRKSKNKKNNYNQDKESLIQRLMDNANREQLKENIIRKTPMNRSNKVSRKKDYKQGGFIGLEMFDVEPKAHTKPFREVSVEDSSRETKKKSRKSKSKKSFKMCNKSGGKKRKNSSKKTNSSKKRKSTIKVKNSTPSYLRYDLERLLDNNYDNIAFYRIF